MSYQFGAVMSERGFTFRVWAPAQRQVSLVLGETELTMDQEANGFFRLDIADARPGQRYWYRIAQGLRPDPASRFQPDGPLGPSVLVDGREFPWNDRSWPGCGPPHCHVIYEMHIGTFTEEGTWQAARQQLPRLAELGVTTLEIMPIASFPGRFGWGYDGVHLYAPAHQYGSADDVRRFVDEAHRLGLAVILDVVYNHFGPVGNYFAEFAPSVNGEAGEWGASINFDGDGSAPVRDFMTENAAYWVREFHFDGLRLDAVQALRDQSSEHIVSAICRAARAAAGDRRLLLTGECESQDVRFLKDSGAYPDGLDAIWNEDWHHAAVVRLTGRRQAYFTDYQGTAHEFASMARHGFLYQGQWYSWQQQPRGSFALGLPAAHFVCFLENHDQVANTGAGDRLVHEVDRGEWRCLTSLLLLGPALPLLFQGQEFASSRPFAYFADHEGDLATSVERGRLKFLSQFPNLQDPEMHACIPPPAELATFTASKLRDDERNADTVWQRLHRDLLRLRKEDPVLSQLGTDAVRVETSAPSEHLLLLRYLGARAHRLLVVNLGDDRQLSMNDPLLAPVPGAPWQSLWASERPQYGGRGVMTCCGDGAWIVAGRSATLLGSTR